MSNEGPKQLQAEIAKVRFIENTIEELREERQQRKAIIENIEDAIKNDPRAVAELVMKNRDEIPFEIDSLRNGIFIRKENKERIQRVKNEIKSDRPIILIDPPTPRQLREKDLLVLEDAIRNHPEEALKALIVERRDDLIPDTRIQKRIDLVEDLVVEREVDRFIAKVVEDLRRALESRLASRITE